MCDKNSVKALAARIAQLPEQDQALLASFLDYFQTVDNNIYCVSYLMAESEAQLYE